MICLRHVPSFGTSVIAVSIGGRVLRRSTSSSLSFRDLRA
jgi:hypothetical protein